MSYIDLEKTNAEGPECPFCGHYYYADCDDYGLDCENLECEECGEMFVATAEHSVEWRTNPVECEDRVPEEPHEWGEFGEPIAKISREGWFVCRYCNKCGAFDSKDVDAPERGQS